MSDPRVIGINIFPWGGPTGDDLLPIAGGAYAGLNIQLGPKWQPNATAAWAAIGNKIRAGQHLPVLPLTPPPPPPPPLIASLDATTGHPGTHTGDGADAQVERLSSELAKARALIRSLRAQVQALQAPAA